MRGQDLYTLLFNTLDLPDSIKASYLSEFLKKYSISSEEITVEILREIVADLLQETILGENQAEQPSLVQNQ